MSDTKKIQWKKLPSVTREGKFFHRAVINGTTYTVLQSWLTGGWRVENNHNGLLSNSEFKTARAAIAKVEGRQ
jgi:hypothetical protein